MEQLGHITELKFLLKATEIGLMVSKPLTHHSKYDFLVDSDGIISRVQVKSTNTIARRTKKAKLPRYKIMASNGANLKKAYTSLDIDFMVCYINCEDTWYIIPIKLLRGRVTLTFVPSGHKDQDEFFYYKNNWDGLKKLPTRKPRVYYDKLTSRWKIRYHLHENGSIISHTQRAYKGKNFKTREEAETAIKEIWPAFD